MLACFTLETFSALQISVSFINFNVNGVLELQHSQFIHVTTILFRRARAGGVLSQNHNGLFSNFTNHEEDHIVFTTSLNTRDYMTTAC